MRRLLALTAVLGLAIASDVSVRHLSEGDLAEAADFRGRIKRVRIRERASGTDYNLTPIVGSDDMDILDFPVEVALTHLGYADDDDFVHEPVIFDAAPSVVTRTLSTTVRWSGDLPGKGFALQVNGRGKGLTGRWTFDDTGAQDSSWHRLPATEGQPTTDVRFTFVRDKAGVSVGVELREKANRKQGFELVGDAPRLTLSLSDLADPTRTGKGLLEPSLDDSAFDVTYRARTEAPADGLHQLQATLLDPKGNVQDEVSNVAFVGDFVETGVVGAQVKLRAKGGEKVVVQTFSEGRTDLDTLRAEVWDPITGKTLAELSSTAARRTTTFLSVDGLAFDGDPTGHGYDVQLLGRGVLPKECRPSGRLVFGRAVQDFGPTGEAPLELNKARTTQAKDGTWSVELTVVGECAAQVDRLQLDFEPTKAPAPLEDKAMMQVDGRHATWVLPFDDETDAPTYAVKISGVRSTGGHDHLELDEPPISLTAGFGKGTKNSASNAASRPELL